MNLHLDFKSMLIGALLLLCIVLAMGASNRTSSTGSARFQLALPGEGNNAYIINTDTGQVWEKHPTGGDSAVKFRKQK
jgi:hypothetical protein